MCHDDMNPCEKKTLHPLSPPCCSQAHVGSVVTMETSMMAVRQKQEVSDEGSLPSVSNKPELLCDRTAARLCHHMNQTKRKKTQPPAEDSHHKHVELKQRCTKKSTKSQTSEMKCGNSDYPI